MFFLCQVDIASRFAKPSRNFCHLGFEQDQKKGICDFPTFSNFHIQFVEHLRVAPLFFGEHFWDHLHQTHQMPSKNNMGRALKKRGVHQDLKKKCFVSSTAIAVVQMTTHSAHAHDHSYEVACIQKYSKIILYIQSE